ncbi:hypothetical protein AWC38_SpisGene3816 [Stylophora pistillata]|uniref:SWIM-type domain-containing protein n=1 Tax=Stylophora pistillata TaxID=50429 RepID=A0A2B4SQL0_STYPI|nr:hypothetical protein AWC38_SpisGene3816 [Stylophora pistillata]
MDRPVEKMHVNELRQFLRDHNAILKGLTVKAQLVARAKEILQRKEIPVNKNNAQAQACAPTKKTSNFSGKMKKNKFCPSEKEMKKCLDGLPPFTYNSVVKYVRTSGKSMKQSPDYMVMKPFERGVNFFIEGYLHDVVAHHHVESQTFYLIALCYRSLRKSEPPHKLQLTISTKQPYFVVLGSSCTCVAGSLGFCNHAIWLMYLVSHFFRTKIKVIPDDLASTSLPQQWHKPRGKTRSPEPLMDMIFKKPKLDQDNAQVGNWNSRPSGISCSLYPALKVIPSSKEIENFKSNLQEIHGKLGLSIYMTVDGKVIDETEDSPYGILEIKCPYKHRNVTPQTGCSGDRQFHLEMLDDFPVLKETHKYYKQVQGQMGISGAKWCDFITYTFKGMVIERI